MDAFDLLKPELRKLARERFAKPTKIQEMVFEPILKGKNVLMMAPTGTGKTLACMLPIFSKWLETKPAPISILYISPMKSLGRDLLDRLLEWGNAIDMEVAVRHGDTTQHERKLQTEYPPGLMITTPEQIGAMLYGKKLRALLANVKFVIVDEVHEIINSKRGVQLVLLLERVRALGADPQVIALSATIGSPEEAGRFIFNKRKFEFVNAIDEKTYELRVESPLPTAEDRITAERICIGDTVAARLRKIHEIIMSHRSVLTFTNTREAAEILSSRMRVYDSTLMHEVHHSSLAKEVRIAAEKRFKSEELRSLTCTSSLELGLDIGSIEHVIQYMSPRQVCKLTQRVGRSGHGVGRTSKGTIIAADGDDLFEASVIARKALAGELEPLRVHIGALDVLVHQIVGMSIVNYDITAKEILAIIKNTYPYAGMTEKDLTEVLEFMKSVSLVWIERGKVHRTRKAFQYYFSNLSTIPDNVSYKIIDMTSNTFVGSLDEAFISEHNELGSSFIVRGSPWRVLSVEGDKVYVEPMAGLESSVPAWQGELIPVPFAVAQEVGALRRQIGDLLAKDMSTVEIATKIKERYPVSSQTVAMMTALLKKQTVVPDNRALYMESYGEFTILHACFGSRTNETIARYIAALLSAEYGRVVMSKSDAYRIIFGSVQADDVKRFLTDFKKGNLEDVLNGALERSSLYKYRFVQVAKRMDVIERGAKFDKINLKNLMHAFAGTAMEKETLREVYTEKMDVEKASEILTELASGKLKIKEFKGLSPLGELGLKTELHDIATPNKPEAEILRIFKQRLLNTKQRLVCVNCGKYNVTFKVGEIKDEPRCGSCGSRLLACVHPLMTEAQAIIKKRLGGKDLTEEEQKKLERIRQSADVVIGHGQSGIAALAGRGVGPQTAMRIMGKVFASGKEDALYKEILNAERAWISTKKYWS